jgi:tubulysin polyketide synthase-like protein
MIPSQLLASLQSRGVILTTKGDKLSFDAPTGCLSGGDLALLREHKAALLDLLTDGNIRMHDSALFDVIVEVDFYEGRRIRIPQQSTPVGWTAQF